MSYFGLFLYISELRYVSKVLSLEIILSVSSEDGNCPALPSPNVQCTGQKAQSAGNEPVCRSGSSWVNFSDVENGTS